MSQLHMNNAQNTIHTTRLGQDLETYFIPPGQADLFLPISTIFQLISTPRAGNQLSFNTDRIRSTMRDGSFVKELVGKFFFDQVFWIVLKTHCFSRVSGEGFETKQTFCGIFKQVVISALE